MLRVFLQRQSSNFVKIKLGFFVYYLRFKRGYQYIEYLPFGEIMVQQSTNNIFENVCNSMTLEVKADELLSNKSPVGQNSMSRQAIITMVRVIMIRGLVYF